LIHSIPRGLADPNLDDDECLEFPPEDDSVPRDPDGPIDVDDASMGSSHAATEYLFMGSASEGSGDDKSLEHDGPCSSVASWFSDVSISVSSEPHYDHSCAGSPCSSSSDSMAMLGDVSADLPPHDGGALAKGTANFDMRVNGGMLRLYFDSKTMVASCERHGARCRLTRKYIPSALTNGSKLGQGRPVGLLLAWLAAGLHPAVASKGDHRDIALPSFEDRMAARTAAADVGGLLPFFAFERPLRMGEGPEPPVVP
jgi:hypothetical protein